MPERGAGVDGMDRVSSEQERGNHSEVTPAPAYRPEEALVLVLACLHQDAVGYVGAARYHTRVLVDHGVVGLAGFVVSVVLRAYQLTPQTHPELFDGRFV